MAKDAEKIGNLEERVKALEDFNQRLGWAATAAKAAWTTSGISLLVLIAFVWNYATNVSTIAQHDKELGKLDAKIEKLDARLDGKIEKASARLQSWEDKGFRVAHALFLDGEFIALEGMTIAVKEEGKDFLRVYTVDPALKIDVAGKKAELKDLKLPRKTPIRFMTSDDGIQVIAMEIQSKK